MDFFGDYDEQYDCAFDFAFLSKFFSKGTEDNKTENKIDHDSLFASNESATNNTLNVVKHFEHDHKDETPRWIRRRRFKKGTEEYIIWRREIRLKNRISARKSIEKRQAHIRELETKVVKLKAEIELRKKVAQIFSNSKPAGRLCGLRRVFSASDFYYPTQVDSEDTNSTWKNHWDVEWIHTSHYYGILF